MPQLRIAPTPNPHSLKITLEAGTFLEAGMESFASPDEAAVHPLGSRLFAIPGVTNVFILPQFLTITKDPQFEWDDVLPAVEAAVAAYLPDSDAEA